MSSASFVRRNAVHSQNQSILQAHFSFEPFELHRLVKCREGRHIAVDETTDSIARRAISTWRSNRIYAADAEAYDRAPDLRDFGGELGEGVKKGIQIREDHVNLQESV